MKNKKILYGLLGVGAIAGLYFWNKNKKPNKPTQNYLPQGQIMCIKAPC